MRDLQDSAQGGPPGLGCHSLALLRVHARRHRVESGVVARYGHSPLLVSVD